MILPVLAGMMYSAQTSNMSSRAKTELRVAPFLGKQFTPYHCMILF